MVVVMKKKFLAQCPLGVVFAQVDARYYFKLQAGTGDEFLDELLSNDASLDEGAVPDIKVMDSSINMSGTEV